MSTERSPHAGMTPTPDPAKIVGDHLAARVGANPDDASTEAGVNILRTLREAGWFLVRTDRCPNPDAGMACGCQQLTITEEWTP